MDIAMLDVLCPMHLVLSATGHICRAGPTATRLIGNENTSGRFLEVFELQHPRGVGTFADLLGNAGCKLRLGLRGTDGPGLKGILVPCGAGGAVVNLSFGIALADGVRKFGLTGSDFAVTDLAMEMLYLIEAKSAAMTLSRKLNLRLQGAMVAAEEQAYSDTLTGLRNRRAVHHVLPRLIAGGGGFSVMLLDLDLFKAVNDEMGHAMGDRVLCETAQILRAETRENDCVARVGGDEFVLIFAELTDTDRLTDIAARIIRRIEEPIVAGSTTCNVSCSIGIAISDLTDPLTEARILQDADTALYASKRAGRGRATLFDPACHMMAG